MNHAAKVLANLVPFTVESLSSLPDEELARLDQFIYRFTKAQDSMSRRLLPSLYTWLENDPSPRPFLDVINRLEQLGVLLEVSIWQKFRNLRNSLAHDYPDSQDQTVATINELFASIGDFISLFQTAREYFMSRSSE